MAVGHLRRRQGRGKRTPDTERSLRRSLAFWVVRPAGATPYSAADAPH